MMRPVVCSMSAAARASCLRRSAAHSSTATAAAVFPGASAGSATRTTSSTGWDGGRTKLANLALLCRGHHRAVHEDGYGMHVAPDGGITFTRPDGRLLPDAPSLPRLREDRVDRLIAANRDGGLKIDPWTATPTWHGERLDLDYAIRGLRAL